MEGPPVATGFDIISNREPWLTQVGEVTAAARFARASKHDVLARKAEKGQLPFREPSDSSRRWHEGRARGQRETVERVLACGTKSAVLACSKCGTAPFEPQPVRCGKFRYCVSCRGFRCMEYRELVTDGIEEKLAEYAWEMHRQVAPWRPKFLTLTVPHSGSAARDTAVLHAAWRRFSVLVRLWVTRKERPFNKRRDPIRVCKCAHHRTEHSVYTRCAVQSPELPNYCACCSAETYRERPPPRVRLPYLRVLEVTGSDAGHVHCHAWLLGPYLPHTVLRTFWGRALSTAGCHVVPVRRAEAIWNDMVAADGGMNGARLARERREFEQLTTYNRQRGRLRYLPWPRLDIRRADERAPVELVKYLTKDIGPDGETVDPFVYGNLIEATEGRRLICASRDFWPHNETLLCDCCERPYVLIDIKRPGEDINGRGNGTVRGPPLP